METVEFSEDQAKIVYDDVFESFQAFIHEVCERHRISGPSICMIAIKIITNDFCSYDGEITRKLLLLWAENMKEVVTEEERKENHEKINALAVELFEIMDEEQKKAFN